MKILAIDASTRCAGAALMEDEKLIWEASLDGGLTHSQTLMPLIESGFSAAGWSPRELDVVGAVAGPGSFTGIRIGIATAKGLAQAAGAKTAAVGTLKTLAMNAAGFNGVVVPLLDARKSQVYTAAYGFRGTDPVEIFEPRALALDEWIETLKTLGDTSILLCGDGMAPYGSRVREALGERVLCAPAHMVMQRPAACAELTRRMALAGEVTDPGQLLPIYVRSSSALTIEERKKLKEARA